MGYRLGVDVGGTFTDLALYDADGNRLEFAKTPSTPDNQAVGVAAGIAELAARYGVGAEQVELFIHGTTVATNTLLERKGASTALVVTAGFRDVLQIGRQERPSLYDWRIRRPEPLAPRRLRFEVEERVLYTGEVLTPLTGAEVDRVVAELAGAGVDAIASLANDPLTLQNIAAARINTTNEFLPAAIRTLASVYGSAGAQEEFLRQTGRRLVNLMRDDMQGLQAVLAKIRPAVGERN